MRAQGPAEMSCLGPLEAARELAREERLAAAGAVRLEFAAAGRVARLVAPSVPASHQDVERVALRLLGAAHGGGEPFLEELVRACFEAGALGVAEPWEVAAGLAAESPPWETLAAEIRPNLAIVDEAEERRSAISRARALSGLGLGFLALLGAALWALLSGRA